MSINRLTKEERAVYLLGKAIRHTLQTAPRDPEMVREIDIVNRWLEAALTGDEIEFIAINTGYLIGCSDDPEEANNLYFDSGTPPDDEEIPF